MCEDCKELDRGQKRYWAGVGFLVGLVFGIVFVVLCNW